MSNVNLEGIVTALDAYNHDYSQSWEFGTNWSNVSTGFETFVNKYLFPKLSSTELVETELGNRFNDLAKEVDFISQFSEEYVVLDAVPIGMNLSKSEELMLKRNYPKLATKLYGGGVSKKVKFTLNNNDVRHNFLTLGDAVKYALGVYRKKVSDINVQEEREIKSMLVDYSLNRTKDVRPVTSLDDLINEAFHALLNLQNNSERYNEADSASGGAIGRYTTITDLKDVYILTSDKVKAQLLNTHIADKFNIQGLDFSDRIISFDTLGGTWKLNKDVTLTTQKAVNALRVYDDYQVEQGDIIPEGTVFTFDISDITELANNAVEIKPEDDELFAYIFDVNKLRYNRYTKNMLKSFENPEFLETSYWLHYHSSKAVSPFYNNVLLTAEAEVVEP